MKYPIVFENKVTGAFGTIGREWLNELDITVQKYLDKWDLQSEGPVDNLSYNYVLKVNYENDNRAILKLGVPNYDFDNEIRTLHTYNGKGCVQVIKSEPECGAMLLEHLLPGTMLVEVEEMLAIKHFAKVWTQLRRQVEKNADHPSIKHWMRALDRYLEVYTNNEGPISTYNIQLAQTYFNEICNTSIGSELLHGDLHHENILFSDKYGWIAIDPKGVIGDPYFDFISFLTNQLFHKTNPKQLIEQRVIGLCEEMNLDKDRLLKSGFTMSILYACWGIEDNDSDWKKTYQCALWFEELRDPKKQFA
ncbi:aminoglycoside phosphotransferase family protein [Psychrobacillus vulpis]|uniref:Aminoglycoside resistance protein n=1 Tax=Psychrobacillus vulpis TaxID=2325572 RepID=A0A544TT45_9BACI|nr:aminoglycoside phosphotransferase family protein [Psychrobacillus vulpis]TQR20609.1 hypothetical protein FG384_05790 [Psychrobacillus vulpis]